jgi:hypothetical protein
MFAGLSYYGAYYSPVGPIQDTDRPNKQRSRYKLACNQEAVRSNAAHHSTHLHPKVPVQVHKAVTFCLRLIKLSIVLMTYSDTRIRP